MKDKPVILVVDDQPQNIELLEAYLVPQGYEIVSAASGEDALEKLTGNQIDLMLLDIIMPGIDGFEVTRRVRQNTTYRLLPIILITVLREPEARVKGIEAGCDDFITRPLDKMELFARVRSLLKVKAYNDLMSNYRKDLESEVTRRTEELRQAFIFQQCLIDALSAPVFYKDFEGRFEGCNRSFEKLFGRKRAELIGTSVYELSPKELDDLYQEKDQALLQNPGIQIFESVVKDAFGIIHNVVFHKATFNNLDGSVGGLIGVILDITDLKTAETMRKELEAQLNQAQKMEAVGRLAGGVAHDYNNMLSVIVGYSELALEEIAIEDPVHEYIHAIHDAAIRSTDITRQLLAFARKQTIAPVALDLNKTVESMLRMLSRLIGEDIDLAWRPGSELWPVKMDPSQVDQMLANLCVNARDALHGVGHVTIETGTARFDATYCADHLGFIPGEYVLLAVSDDGCGMDRETIAKIFEPFFTTKGIGQGTGLGLSTVYGIVKQNNGFINVYSEPGKGTTFKIYLARHTDQAVEAPKVDSLSITHGHGETILIVEDEVSILELAKRILGGLGYTVLIARLPSQALHLAEEYSSEIHLLITDVVMPEMNGKELSNRLRTVCPTLRTLFMSGYTANVIAHRGVLDQGVQFMQKPFSKESMAQKVREALES